MHNGGTMDTVQVYPQVRDQYKCTICYEIFLYPVCLPCKHRFCKLCLDKHMENNKMCCPICRSRVSNWLRQLRRSNGDVVDKPFWDTVQRLFPEEVDKRINGHTDYDSCLVYFWKRVSKFDGKEKSRSANLHKAFLDKRYSQDLKSDWHGWPEPVFDVCWKVLRWAKDDPINKSPPTNYSPRRSLAKPGEIHEEYEQFLLKELEEKRRQEEENFRLSEAMIKMIEEDKRREEEERIRQLQKDEELARRLEEEAVADNSGTLTLNEENERREEVRIQQLQKDEKLARRLEEEAATNNSGTSNELPEDNSGISTLSFPPGRSIPLLSQSSVCPDTPSTSKDRQHPQSSVYHNTPTPSTSKGTPTQCSQSPVRLDTPSTSKKNIFAKFFAGASSPSTKDKTLLQENTSSGSKTSISNKELSHFVTLRLGPSDVINGPKSKKKKETVPSSRCSSGCDSIGQELNHFKPIRSSPTTPPKEGSRELIPKVVVAQRGIGVPDLSICSPLDLLGADVSLEELETSLNLEKQIEEDKRLAMEIQNQLNEEMKKPMKGEYNLRKRKRTSDSLKKKVLLDRTQTTLDNLLIK